MTKAGPVQPPRRRFTVRGRPEGLREIDAADRAFRLKALVWSGVVGFAGILVSQLLAVKVGAEPPLLYLFWLGGPLTGAVMYRMVMGLTEAGAAVAGKIHNPSGSSTPVIREYSRPQALAAQGHAREAVEAYEDCVTVYPEDPEPYVRIARILRDKLGEFEQAARWFRRARSESNIDPGREMLVTQEIIEIYRRRLDQPERAIPELARLVDRFPDHPLTPAARRELAELRREHQRRDAVVGDED